jgi:hypothetical protein
MEIVYSFLPIGLKEEIAGAETKVSQIQTKLVTVDHGLAVSRME